MIELTIKTLDAQNHHFTVPDDYTVEQLKEHIAETIQIPSDAQRCIYLGQVLQNEIKLSECDVNGKVIHVVQRPPPSSAYAAGSTASTNASNSSSSNRRPDTHTGTMYLGAMAFPSDFIETGGLTFLHSRTNLSVNRLVVARNLLRRAMTIINSLENGNYFSTTSEQSQSQSNQAANTLAEDMNNAETSNGLTDPPEVEIRIEIPNSQHDAVPEAMVGGDDANEAPESVGMGASESGDQPTTDENAAGGTLPGAQPEGESSATGSNTRDEANRRRSRTPMMATVMGAVLHTQVRLIPYMRLLRQYLLQDTAFGPDATTTHTEQQVQSLYNSVSELMHYFAHIYHMLSDIMCDFSQPPPRTLRCRSVVVQQQHASLLRSGSRGRSTVIRSPVVAVARTSAPSTATNDTGSNTTPTPETTESAPTETVSINVEASVPAVEVVIEEADTTNLLDNNEEGNAENMDTSEPVIAAGEEPANENGANANGSSGSATMTVRGRSGNTYVIQSMPDGIVPEGIRINSVEATILTPNEDIASALGSGTNQRWRGGFLPAEVLQNMFGFVNQFRQNHRPRSSSAGDRSRSQSTTNSTSTGSTSSENAQAPPTNSNTSHTTESTPNPQNTSTNSNSNSNERYVEIDVPGISRTFDPFLPCHSHHIHPTLARAGAPRTFTNLRSATQASSSQSEHQSQTTQATPQQSADQAQPTAASQSSAQEGQNQAQTDGQFDQGRRTAEFEGTFAVPDPRHVMNVINSMFPVFGNVMIRRNNAASSNSSTSTEGNDRTTPERSTSRARIQLTSNMNNFPGAIHIEIDPVTNNIQTNVVPNTNAETSSTPRTRSRRRTASRRPRAYAMSERREPRDASNPVNPETAFINFTTWPPVSSMSSSSSSSSSNSSSSSDIDSPETRHEDKKAKKEKRSEYTPSKTIKNMYSTVKKETVRYLLGSKKSKTPKNEVTNNTFPLYKENQEAAFFDIVKAVVNSTSVDQIIRGGDNIDQLTSCLRRKIRSHLVERNIAKCDKQSLLNAVNILINNDLFKMKYLLDSDSVKQEIDLVSTLGKFNQDSVPELIECVVKTEDLSETEIRKFGQIFNFYVARLLSLFVYCITGDDKTVHIKKVLGSVVEEAIKGLPNDDELIRWLRKDLINHVISYSKICHPDNLPSFMRRYVVYRLPPVIPVECTVATATITNFGTNEQQNAEQSQPMEVEDAAQSSSSTSSEASFVSFNSEDNAQQVPEQSNNNETTGEGDSASQITSVTPPNEPLPEVVLNSEEWHRSFPSEWVPIIARDIHRLRRQGSQPPFSDAYLSGMPTKRRKLIKNSKPDLNNTNQLITGNISSAIDSAGLSSSISAITNHVNESTINASEEGSLAEIVKEELKENVHENGVQQPDFLPRRFPDSAKYFMDK